MEQYGIEQLFELANYNHASGNEGWIYDWENKFKKSNQEIFTEDLSKQALTDLPSLSSFKKITDKMVKEKQEVETEYNLSIQMEENYERGITK